MGRPSKFDEAIAAEICARLASGENLNVLCREDRMPPARTVRSWALDDVQGFAARFARARELQAHCWAEQSVVISDEIEGPIDNAVVAAARLRIDTRRWFVSKILPRTYGDKLEMTGAGGQPLLPANAQSADRAGHMLAVIARAAQSNRATKQIEHAPSATDDDGKDDGYDQGPKD